MRVMGAALVYFGFNGLLAWFVYRDAKTCDWRRYRFCNTPGKWALGMFFVSGIALYVYMWQRPNVPPHSTGFGSSGPRLGGGGSGAVALSKFEHVPHPARASAGPGEASPAPRDLFSGG